MAGAARGKGKRGLKRNSKNTNGDEKRNEYLNYLLLSTSKTLVEIIKVGGLPEPPQIARTAQVGQTKTRRAI
ncbi:MAG: hypothetical protein KGS72_17645 [Cyanobacteria bacterium REEB67]|nr:hypothetical protein [Cyanobacteria bacterium REEB67]